MKESSLHYIWENRLYSKLTFYEDVEREETVDGELLQPGIHNTDGGPDFLEGKLQVGKLILAGDIELHARASEWYAHRHHLDPAYDSVVLHAVLEADRNILHRTTKKPLLTAVIHCTKKVLAEVEGYERAKATGDLPPRCNAEDSSQPTKSEGISADKAEASPHAIAPPEANSPTGRFYEQAEDLFLARLEEKAGEIAQIVAATQSDLAETLHRLILKHLGAKVNNEAFLQVAGSLPLRILRKHTDSVASLEALYLGQASLLYPLEEKCLADSYLADLQQRYHFLAAKYDLRPIAAGRVRMLRLRPPAFPHRRLAIAAQLRATYPLLESLLLSGESVANLNAQLSTPPSDYWQNHYAFGVASKKPLGGLSADTLAILLLNVVLPYRYYSYLQKGLNPSERDALIAFASELPAEKNKHTERLRARGIKLHNALHSQAAIQLLKNAETPLFS